MLHDELKMFGKVGVVTTKLRIQPKICSWVIMCVSAGDTENHSKDLNRMLISTKNSIISLETLLG
jgi:hypothetical protein